MDGIYGTMLLAVQKTLLGMLVKQFFFFACAEAQLFQCVREPFLVHIGTFVTMHGFLFTNDSLEVPAQYSFIILYIL